MGNVQMKLEERHQRSNQVTNDG